MTTAFRISARRRAAALAGSVVALLALAGALSPAAQGHYNQLVDGCTGVDSGYTCFQIYGIGGTTHVDKFVQVRSKDKPQICNYQARFTVSQNNSVYWSAWSSYHQGCYYFYRATRTVGVERNFRNPSKACGSWYENGSRLGTACNILSS